LGVGSGLFVFRVGIYAVNAISSIRPLLFDYSLSVYSFHILVLYARDLSSVNPINTGGIEIKGNFQKKKFKN
jgi:hypothetical protein